MEKWFDDIRQGKMDSVMNQLADNIVFELPLYEHNKIISYLGTMHGRAEVADALKVRAETTEVLEYENRGIVGQGNEAWAIVYTKANCRETQAVFEIEDSHHFILNEEGKIASWKVYFDSYLEVTAFKKNIDVRLLAAIDSNDDDQVQYLLKMGANPNVRDKFSGLTALIMASGYGNAAIVKLLLDAGADVFAVDSRGGASAVHKAIQGGSSEIVKMLLDAGAFVDWAACTTGHTPLMDALWFKRPDMVQLLLNRGAGMNLGTHYGFTMQQHFEYELNVNTEGKDLLLKAEEMLNSRKKADHDAIEAQQLMVAVNDNDVDGARQLIAEGADIDARYPYVNGFNDAHTPLLVACRDGRTAIVAELLKAGANVNAVEPTFGAVPLHKAVYNGHAEITRLLVRQEGIDLNFQGCTNGYTALHDALWHGYQECATILIEAGARLDLKGHDGKLPVDIAVDTFGNDHEMVRSIQEKMVSA
jgi:ankyrin repeat protein